MKSLTLAGRQRSKLIFEFVTEGKVIRRELIDAGFEDEKRNVMLYQATCTYYFAKDSNCAR